jgi:surface antigen
MRRTGMAVVLAGALAVAGCDTPGLQNDQQAGGLIGGAGGAIAGGIIGNSFGGFGGLIGGVLGSVGGYLVGSAIGARLDQADRQRAEAATQRALAAPTPETPVAWHSDHNTGVSGSAQVVSQQPQSNGGECRDVREVAYINGEQTTQTSRYCRGPSGAWTRQA